jgi:uncharacterized membrane protein
MSNAKLQYSLSQKEADDQPQTKSNFQGTVEKINFVKTFDTPELAKKFTRYIPKDYNAKTSIENNKITVNDITDYQKKNLMASALKFIDDNKSKKNLREALTQLVKEVLSEKKLTTAEKKKREEIVKAMAKQGASKDAKTYAIATAKAEKLTENEEADVIDTITMDVPLFIRMLEYSREDASNDMDLHDVAEKAITLNKEKEHLSMEDYNQIIGETNNED